MEKEIKELYEELRRELGRDAVFRDELSLVAFSADAGCYSKKPQIGIKPRSEEEMKIILSKLNKKKISLTFRAAGTSLSGQSISDSVLIIAAGDKWGRAEVLENGKFIKTQPGITGARLNQILKPFGVKFGPDPASVNSAMVGGIIANNASGMICGTHANSYATIKSARILLSDGTLLDTSDEYNRQRFLMEKPEIVNTIKEIKNQIQIAPGLADRIRKKYEIKNTTGYGMNSFIDYEDPIDIILHLMVGSEGTLGFVSEAVFSTVKYLPFRASSLVYFRNLEDACNAVPSLRDCGVPAIELMDRNALRSVENKKEIPDYIKQFDENVSSLLIDLEAETEAVLFDLLEKTRHSLSKYSLVREFDITRDPHKILEYWKVRKGVFPSVGGMRPPGTAVIIEDVAISMEHFGSAVLDMRKMLDENDYKDAVIYGHALDGNLHFIFSQDFENPDELKRYNKLITELTKLIVEKYDGSLKAEHGTGLNMAPFVKYEWGEEMYEAMRKIKKAFDPNNIINPGVLINDNPGVHLENFKKLPEIDPSVDKCIECGFCEISCLSTGFSLSARQRIVVQRELKMLRSDPGNKRKVKKIERAFQYMGDKSCAGDGLCSITCPLDIDTGILIKKLRQQKNRDKTFAPFLADKIAGNFKSSILFLKAGLASVSFIHRIIGSPAMEILGNGIRKLSFNTIPQWNRYMPQSAKNLALKAAAQVEEGMKVVYFPSCINQAMGPPLKTSHEESLVNVTIEVLKNAGFQVVFPEHMSDLCCGMPWESKGFIEIANMKSGELEIALMKASNFGAYPVLCDTSPCIYRMKKVMNPSLKLYEPVEFVHDFLLNRLNFIKQEKRLAFHITCSSVKMDLEEKFRKVAAACVTNPVFPEEVGCCGFAGDKGFSLPELNDWALRKLKTGMEGCEEGISNSRTCEIGLSKNSGVHYHSIMYLVNECTTAMAAGNNIPLGK